MGPFELMDLIGNDVNAAVTRTVWTAFNFDPRFDPSRIQDELVAAGRYGRKTGHGFYDYARVSRREPTLPSLAPAADPGSVELHGVVCPARARFVDRSGVEVVRRHDAGRSPRRPAGRHRAVLRHARRDRAGRVRRRGAPGSP